MKTLGHIFFYYFLILGFSDAWGGHFHHTDNYNTNDTSHIESHSEANHHHEESNEVADQDHCVQHCSVENILTHLLEDKIVNRGNTFSFDNNQSKDAIFGGYLKSAISFKPELLSYYSNTIPPPSQSQWNTLTNSPRPPPSLS